MERRLIGLTLEALLIATIAGLAAFAWSLSPEGGLAPVFGLCLFVSVSWIYFLYDDRPKGDLRSDLALLIMSFVVELGLLIVSIVVTLAAAGVVLTLHILLGTPIPTIANVLLATWIGLNLLLYFHERKSLRTV